MCLNVLTYGEQSWTMIKRNMKFIKTSQRAMKRIMLRISLQSSQNKYLD